MKRKFSALFAMGGLLIALVAADPAVAQKSGGILRMYSPDCNGSGCLDSFRGGIS
jgi:hypothetical protein